MRIEPETEREDTGISLCCSSHNRHCASPEHSAGSHRPGNHGNVHCGRHYAGHRHGIFPAGSGDVHDPFGGRYRCADIQDQAYSTDIPDRIFHGCNHHHLGTGSSGAGRTGALHSESDPDSDSGCGCGDFSGCGHYQNSVSNQSLYHSDCAVYRPDRRVLSGIQGFPGGGI